MKRLPRALLIGIQLLVSAGFIALLLRRVDLGALSDRLAMASLPLLALSLGTKLAGLGLMALRLERIAHSCGALGFGRAFRAQSITFVGNNVLPLRLGEALRVGFLARSGGVPAFACVGLAAIERVLDSVFLVLFIAAALILFPRQIPTTSALHLFSALAIGAFVSLHLAARFPTRLADVARFAGRPLGERAAAMLAEHALHFARGIAGLASLRVLSSITLLTAGYWVTSALSVSIWLAACSIEVPWYAAIVVLVFVSLATVIPSAPGFIGTYHYFAVLALSLFDVAPEAATSFAIVGHATAIVPFTLLLAPFVARDILSLLHARAAGSVPRSTGASTPPDEALADEAAAKAIG